MILTEENYNKLLLSKENGRAIGLKIKGQRKLLITAVDILPQIPQGEFLRVKPHCIYGEVIENPNIPLKDIEDLILFHVSYEDDLYQHLRHIKSNVRSMKDNVRKIWSKEIHTINY